MSALTHADVESALLDREGDAPLAPEVEAHLAGCDACRGLAEALGQVDAGLSALAPIAPSPELMARTLEAARSQPAPAESAEVRPDLGLGGLLAASVAGVLSGLWAIARLLFAPVAALGRAPRAWRLGFGVAVPAMAALALFVGGGLMTLGARDEPPAATVETSAESGLVDYDGDGVLDTPEEVVNGDLGGDLDDDFGDGEGERVAFGQGLEWQQHRAQGQLEQGQLAQAGEWEIDEEEELDVRGFTGAREGFDPTSTFDLRSRDRGVEERRGSELSRSDDGSRVSGRQIASNLLLEDGEQPRGGRYAEELNGARGPESGSTTPRGTATANTGAINSRPTDTSGSSRETSTVEPSVVDRQLHALGYVVPSPDEADALEGLRFQPATGYWANTYLPGDPAMRTLQRRLVDHPAASALAALAAPADPRLDPPRQGALALRVAANRAAVEGRSRVLVSVGLRGAAQRAGRRPTLRTQVVLDLRRPLDEAGQARVRALLTALSRTREGADRTGVIVAGPRGGELLPLGQLRFGEVSVALGRAFDAPTGEPTDLVAAVERAVTSIGQLEDDASPLGSSLVLVVSPGLDARDVQEVGRVAHTGTLAGVTTTAVGLGDGGSLDALERLALAGHGRRRVLSEPGEADTLVRDEAAAVSRVVARAVRLRLRLAEGVQLVDVLGSRRLDEAAAQRVRASERAIDQALARRLGITADRGEDEDGIQIVVPAFYAGDSHTVLLDLVVPGPGPVLDVTARFKDLLRLGNGALTDRLTLARGAGARGPQARAVEAERLAYELAASLREAASRAERGDRAGATAALAEGRARLDRARARHPELASEPALARDATAYDRFGAALGAGAIPSDTLAGALRYAAHRRMFGDPLALGQ